MAYQFYVIMQKRADGKIYADLHKTTGRLYFTEADAERARSEMGILAQYFHTVALVALTDDEWLA